MKVAQGSSSVDADGAPRKDPFAQRLISGDQRVLGELLATFAGRGFPRLKMRFGRQLDDAELEDVVSRALFKVWLHRARFDRAIAGVLTWMYVIAEREALSAIRRKHRMPRSNVVFAEREVTRARASADSQDARESEIKCDDERSILAQLMADLNGLDRAILEATAAATDGAAWANAVASEFNVSAGSLRVRKVRLIARIRREIEIRLANRNITEQT